jgi:hypothetical protein
LDHLLVNVAAALVLIPHRGGDANVRAVWYFSRDDAVGNLSRDDAVGNLAVNIAAGLFPQSSWTIVRDARAELRAARESS